MLVDMASDLQAVKVGATKRLGAKAALKPEEEPHWSPGYGKRRSGSKALPDGGVGAAAKAPRVQQVSDAERE